MGHIGSHLDITSGWRRHQGRRTVNVRGAQQRAGEDRWTAGETRPLLPVYVGRVAGIAVLRVDIYESAAAVNDEFQPEPPNPSPSGVRRVVPGLHC